MPLNLLGWLRKRPARRPAPSTRPRLEGLEDRQLMDVGIGLSPVTGFAGLTNPVLATNAGDGSNRLFVVEQRGRILVRQPSGAVSTFLDISAAAVNPAHRRVAAGGERGLIGLAFHPDYETNGLFYLHHTRSGMSPTTNDIVEYRVGAGTPDAADPATERLLLRIPQPTASHNGGSIEFGPDGLLYIGKGDGSDAGDEFNNAQNLNILLGKILRIDVNSDGFPADPSRNYAIPPDNPFVGVDGALPEVYAYGLRNPYRFSFDRGSGLLYVGDVGQGQAEEIDIVVMGGNYGWRAFEGFGPQLDGDDIGYPEEVEALRGIALDPILDLGRDVARSIIGGYVYRGTGGTLPVGSYLFGDFITRTVFLYQDGGWTSLLEEAGTSITSFGEDEAGELYVMGLAPSQIFKVVTTSTNRPPVLTQPPDRTLFPTQDRLTVIPSAEDPDGWELTYSATVQSLALVMDTRLGLRTYADGELFLNAAGRGEKWLLDRNDRWYFVLPNGALYLDDDGPGSGGSHLANLGSTYYDRIDLLYNAQLAFDLDLSRGLWTDGDLFLNSGWRDEKWLQGRNGEWYFLLPTGDLFLWDQMSDTEVTGTHLASAGESYYELIHLLYEGDQGQALAQVSVGRGAIRIDRDDGFEGAVVVTAIVSDGELTDRKSFTVSIATL